MKKLFILTVFVFCRMVGFSQNAPPLPPPPPPDSSKNEEMPQFPGGEAAFFKFLQDSIRYPQLEKEKGIEGMVYVMFTVEKDGSITDVHTIKGVPGAPGLSKEAERVISVMPKWKPGKLNGKPVRVNVTQPIKFVLEKDPPKKKRSAGN